MTPYVNLILTVLYKAVTPLGNEVQGLSPFNDQLEVYPDKIRDCASPVRNEEKGCFRLLTKASIFVPEARIQFLGRILQSKVPVAKREEKP